MTAPALSPVPPSSPAPHVSVVHTPEDLERIHDDGISLCLLERSAPVSLAGETAAIVRAPLFDVRGRTSASTFAADVATLLLEAGLDAADYGEWMADLERLAASFFALAGHRPVTLRLETSDDDGCRRFHADRSYLRLLCTYHGPGTEWLANEQVDRAALDAREPNEAVVRHGEPARFAPFWAGVFKGSLYPGDPGLVHRSPPIAGTGQTRLRFCLDC